MALIMCGYEDMRFYTIVSPYLETVEAMFTRKC